ncbi:MAG TPA: hypothetical protein VH134_01110 [Candidatus Dormibacteraeota bacterium]|nr:hypothetical protein [Candidatus Dormibacteraeota bacterium]
MGEGTAQARRREVELTREALAEDVERFARKVRSELDWKARLRRDGPQIVAIAGAIAALVVVGLVLRAAVRSRDDDDDEVLDGATVEDVARELRLLREDLEKRFGNSGGGILQKVAVAAAGSAATAGGKVAAGRLLDRVEAEQRHQVPVGSAS